MTRFPKTIWAAGLLFACSGVKQPDTGKVLAETAFDATAFEGKVSEKMLALLQEQSKALHGEAADLDGDGVRETTSFIGEDGWVRWESDPNGDGFADWYVVKYPNGDFERGIDSLGDFSYGALERYTARTRTWVIEHSTDRMIGAEKRETRVSDAEIIHVTLEEREDKSWNVTRTYDLAAAADDGAGSTSCYGLDGFPDTTGRTPYGNGTSIALMTGGAGGCDPTQQIALLMALECAQGLTDPKQGLNCLKDSNKEAYERLKSAFLGNELLIGCGNGCSEKVATTHDPSFMGTFNPQKSNWNPSWLMRLSHDEMCSNMIHELMHWDGEHREDDHEHGDDQVYACGRYCAGCSSMVPAGTMYKGRNFDCARCGGTDAEKRKCGIKDNVNPMACPAQYTLCHAGLAGNSSCETCRGVEAVACDDSALGAAQIFRCCVSCPGGYPTNDKPCSSAPPPASSCNLKPPFCS